MTQRKLLPPLLSAAALLVAAPAGAFEMDAVAKACSGKEVSVRLAADGGEGAAEREKARKAQGRSEDHQVADHLLRGTAEVKKDGEGSTLGWKRPSGRRGEADCRRRLALIAKRFPGRVSFMDPAKGGMKEVARQAVAPIPAALQQAPADAALAARAFDAGAELARADASAVDLSVPSPLGAGPPPRSSMRLHDRPTARPRPRRGPRRHSVAAFNGKGTPCRADDHRYRRRPSNADPALAAGPPRPLAPVAPRCATATGDP